MPIEFGIFKLVTKSVGGSRCGTGLKILAYRVPQMSVFLFDGGALESVVCSGGNCNTSAK